MLKRSSFSQGLVHTFQAQWITNIDTVCKSDWVLMFVFSRLKCIRLVSHNFCRFAAILFPENSCAISNAWSFSDSILDWLHLPLLSFWTISPVALLDFRVVEPSIRWSVLRIQTHGRSAELLRWSGNGWLAKSVNWVWQTTHSTSICLLWLCSVPWNWQKICWRHIQCSPQTTTLAQWRHLSRSVLKGIHHWPVKISCCFSNAQTIWNCWFLLIKTQSRTSYDYKPLFLSRVDL